MKLEAGEAKKATTSATSTGWPMRPSGVCVAKACEHRAAVLDHALHDVGVDHPRQHGVRADAPAAPLEGEDAGHLGDRPFGRA